LNLYIHINKYLYKQENNLINVEYSENNSQVYLYQLHWQLPSWTSSQASWFSTMKISN